MSNEVVSVAGLNFSPELPFVLIAGPCVIENESLALSTAESLRNTCEKLNLPFVYKSSFDKANRSSEGSYRGPGVEVVLEEVTAGKLFEVESKNV